MRKGLRLPEPEAVLNVEFRHVEITERTVRRVVEYRGQVRRPYNLEEYEAIRQKRADTPLP
jgi:hypothetical protein